VVQSFTGTTIRFPRAITFRLNHRVGRDVTCVPLAAWDRRHHFFSTSFQNSEAGLPLIVCSVLMERNVSASRSAWKSQVEFFEGHPSEQGKVGDLRTLDVEDCQVFAVLEVRQARASHWRVLQAEKRHMSALFEVGEARIAHLRAAQSETRQVPAVLEVARPVSVILLHHFPGQLGHFTVVSRGEL
jgi:hypothetical protein